MSSIYKGLSDAIGPQTIAPTPTVLAKHSYERVVLGHVLDVILDETSPFYSSEYGIGSIRFRVTYDDYRKPEEDVNLYAIPADRTCFKVPLPGEQVLIYPIILNGRLFYVYGQVIGQDHNQAYNAQPFLGSTAENYDVTTLNLFVDEEKLAKRFEEKLTIPLETYQNAAYNIRAPREGDTIIEGRFGGLIQFTSTMEKSIVKAQSSEMIVGRDELVNSFTTGDGDPLLILQANRYDTAGFENKINKVSIDDDDSSVYLTTTQEVPMSLAGSSRMYSWNVVLKTGGATISKDPSINLALNSERYDPAAKFVVNLNVAINGMFGGGVGGGPVANSLGGDLAPYPGDFIAWVPGPYIKSNDFIANYIDKATNKWIGYAVGNLRRGNTFNKELYGLNRRVLSAQETEDFYQGVLRTLGAPITQGNMLFLKAWRKAEGGAAAYNPWNTTQRKPGSTCYNYVNGHCHVQSYLTPEDGFNATNETINNGLYPNIIAGLRLGLQNQEEALKLAEWVQSWDLTGQTFYVAAGSFKADDIMPARFKGRKPATPATPPTT